ncbi:DUF4435 domain-containing protein [Rahnella sp. GSA61A]|uniref:DUF4435 domain-containing protein n=1 Tax=Rahnella sp. GSA61A TaxID=2862678 RepID=UPI001CBFB121|nr:DUF4435 domain-containing protein [Rahnella sp. GSA61A]
MSASRLDMMMNAIKKPCVLRLQLIKKKKKEDLLFIFEGDDDYDFYFNAIKACGFDNDFCHINGKGKDQSVTLYYELLNERNINLKNTYFFVDQDYSDVCHQSENIMTLPVYAIENFLSDERVISHFIKTTFKIDEKNKDILHDVMSLYAKAKDSFYSGIRNISIQLYLSRLWGVATEFPNNEELFDNISNDNVIVKFIEIPEVKERFASLTEDEHFLVGAVESLDKDQLTRGKYVFHFVSTWLIKIKRYVNERIQASNTMLMNLPEGEMKKATVPLKSIQYDHSHLSIAKLSVGCRKVPQLNHFLSLI